MWEMDKGTWERAGEEDVSHGVVMKWAEGRPRATIAMYQGGIRKFMAWVGAPDAASVVRGLMDRGPDGATKVLEGFGAYLTATGRSRSVRQMALAGLRTMVDTARNMGIIRWDVSRRLRLESDAPPERARRRVKAEKRKEEKARLRMKAGLEIATKMHREMSDAEWKALKAGTLLQAVRRADGTFALRAIEAIDEMRDRDKFGTREAIERTRVKCEARLKELDEIEREGRAAGWGGDSGVERERSGTHDEGTARDNPGGVAASGNGSG